MARNGIRRGKDGRFSVTLPPHERNVLRSLPAQVSAIARAGDPGARRLFPPAYVDDLDSEAEYARLMRPELIDGYLETLAAFEKTADATSLSESEALDWLRALNGIRLVVGTKIDVKENEGYPDPESVTADDVRGQGLLLYGYLTWLQGELLGAIARGGEGTAPAAGDED